MLNTAIDLMERGRIPDWLTRIGIRRLLAERLRTGNGHNPQARDVELARLIPQPRDSAVAPRAATVNQQHHEPPAGFFQQVLGPRLKYSACWWPEEVKDLETAEAAMLAADRGGVQLPLAAGVHRDPLPGTQFRQRPGRHRRYERLPH